MKEKNIVFFSHSSRDKKLLARLKDIVLKKTGNAVKIFLSSDGQSIKHGKNWVFSIEDALEGATIMFVFVSPNSLAKPYWLYFESGHAYSKKIKVIPVGILDVDIAAIPEPLNFLMGFNITSKESLGNIIDILNKEFELTNSTKFTISEYEEVFQAVENFNLSSLGNYSNLVHEIKINIDIDNIYQDNRGKVHKKATEILNDECIKFQYFSSGNFYTHGFSFIFWEKEKEDISPQMIFTLDPILISKTIPIAERIGYALNKEKFLKYVFKILFVKQVKRIEGFIRIAARFHNNDISIGQIENYFNKDNFTFKVGYGWQRDETETSSIKVVELLLEGECKSFSELKLDDFINFLFERGVLYEK